MNMVNRAGGGKKQVWRKKCDVSSSPPPPVPAGMLGYKSLHEMRLARHAWLLYELKDTQSALERNPSDVKSLKKLALTLISLAVLFPYDNDPKRMPYLRDAMSKLKLALSIKKDYYEAMYELGKLHYTMLLCDKSLEVFGDAYMLHCHIANDLFKQVKDKAPEFYREDMLKLVRNQMPSELKGPKFWVLPTEDDDEIDEDEDEGVGATSSFKQNMIEEAVDLVFAKFELDPRDTDSKIVLMKAFRGLPIREPNVGDNVHEEGN